MQFEDNNENKIKSLENRAYNRRHDQEIRAEKKEAKIINPQFEVKPIEKTPFAILIDKEKNEVWIILGNEKIKQVNSEEEAKTCARYYDWNILGPTIYKIATDATIRTLEQIDHWKKNKININQKQ